MALPRDEKTLQAVLTLQLSLKEIQALYDVGRYRTALERAVALRPKVETTGYKPLLAELIDLMGTIASGFVDAAAAEDALKESLFMAVGIGDDLVAARSAANLIYVTGYRQGRYDESNNWWALANALLDRVGGGHGRLRSWVIQNRGEVLMRMGHFETARDLFQRAVALKEEALGANHPDVARSLSSLGDAWTELGRPEKALEIENRASAMLQRPSDLADLLLVDRGEALIDLERYGEAETSLGEVLKDAATNGDDSHWRSVYPLTALGRLKLAVGDPSTAVANFERALLIGEETKSDATLNRRGSFRPCTRSLGNRGRSRACSLAREIRT